MSDASAPFDYEATPRRGFDDKGKKVRLPVGRPSEWNVDWAERVYEMAILGLRDEDIAKMLNISVSTLNNWKNAEPTFMEALSQGRDQATSRVSRSLYDQAVGYKRPTVKIFQFQGEIIEAPYDEFVGPNHSATQFYLKNKSEEFDDKSTLEHVGAGGGPIEVMDVSKLSQEERDQLRSIIKKATTVTDGEPE